MIDTDEWWERHIVAREKGTVFPPRIYTKDHDVVMHFALMTPEDEMFGVIGTENAKHWLWTLYFEDDYNDAKFYSSLVAEEIGYDRAAELTIERRR